MHREELKIKLSYLGEYSFRYMETAVACQSGREKRFEKPLPEYNDQLPMIPVTAISPLAMVPSRSVVAPTTVTWSSLRHAKEVCRFQIIKRLT